VQGKISYAPEIIALAAESVSVHINSTCRLFAIPDPTSRWGFTPESFLGEFDWMLSEEGIKQSDFSDLIYSTLDVIERVERDGDANLSELTSNLMKDVEERTTLIELVYAISSFAPVVKLHLDSLSDQPIH
jgi:hypothetical protein